MEKDLIARLEVSVSRLEAMSISGTGGSIAREGIPEEVTVVDPAILAFDDLVQKSVGRLVVAAEKIGGRVVDVTKILEEAFKVQKEMLIKIKYTKKPDKSGLQEFLKPLNEVILKANALTEGRRSDYFNHLKTTADSLTALEWIAYTGKDCGMSLPISHVEESWQMAEVYNNKVLVEYRNKDPDHVEWEKALKEIYLPGLREFVNSFYPLGPVWSLTASGTTSRTASVSSGASSSKVPAAPPPPPGGSLFSSNVSSSRPKEGTSAVFQEIRSGKPVRSGLKKVTSDMKTKNRSDRTCKVSEKEIPSRGASFNFKTGIPKMELQMDRKWAVGNQIGKENLVIDDCDSKQTIYVFGCKDSVLHVKGKVNNITIDKCMKFGILFTDVVAACEIVNCNSVEVQCQGSAPTISVDNTSGCQLYLCKQSLNAFITTSKSSEVNVMVPGAGSDSDWVEHALPQQFVHVFSNEKFTTSPYSHSCGYARATRSVSVVPPAYCGHLEPETSDIGSMTSSAAAGRGDVSSGSRSNRAPTTTVVRLQALRENVKKAMFICK